MTPAQPITLYAHRRERSKPAARGVMAEADIRVQASIRQKSALRPANHRSAAPWPASEAASASHSATGAAGLRTRVGAVNTTLRSSYGRAIEGGINATARSRSNSWLPHCACRGDQRRIREAARRLTGIFFAALAVLQRPRLSTGPRTSCAGHPGVAAQRYIQASAGQAAGARLGGEGHRKIAHARERP